jgi:hypothetical protein
VAASGFDPLIEYRVLIGWKDIDVGWRAEVCMAVYRYRYMYRYAKKSSTKLQRLFLESYLSSVCQLDLNVRVNDLAFTPPELFE